MCRLIPLAMAVVTLGACSAELPRAVPTTPAGASVTATATRPSPTPTLTVDAAVTAQICQVATKEVADMAGFFANQMAVLERAAARGDQDAVVAAAAAIQDRLTALGTLVDGYGVKPISPQLRAVLSQTSTAITEISSPAYPGTQTDIRKTLARLGGALHEVCA